MLPADKRIFGLDLLRCLAIVLVLLTHTIPFLDPQNIYKTSVYTGFFGVEFFFVLSGFLIGTILLKIYHQPGLFDFKNIKIFWIRRWFRTLPNYYLMFAVYAILFYFLNHINVFTAGKYLSYLVFLQNAVSYQPNNFFQVAWSLSIEEWFYLLFPVCLFLLTKVFKTQKSPAFLITILSIIAIELIARFCISIFRSNYWDEGFRKLMPLRLDSIDIGVLAAYIRFHQPAFWNKNARRLAVFGLVLLIPLALYFSLDYAKYFDAVTWDHKIQAGIFLETLFFTLISFSIALLFPYLCIVKINRGFFNTAVTFMSKISYSIYLTHFFLIAVVSHMFRHYSNIKYYNVLLFVCVWVVVILISAIQYTFFEVKMTALRNYISRKQASIKI
jgi:peptidoglycan/LPS O-acetylase OafA/YrhL